ncbi:MAG: MCE family protein [Myxococcales bacterium]|nr:MCE family protein [Myxococcales bacterium]
MKNSGKTELRVGIFVVSALLIATVLVFVVGSQKNVFSSKTRYTTTFETVGGLRPGSPVQMAGVNAGNVESVALEEDGLIHVDLNVIESSAKFIRKDSVVTIGNKGLLGDKLVEISVGNGAPLDPSEPIPSQSPVDLGQYFVKASKIITDAEATVENLRNASEPFADPGFANDVKETAKHLATISRMAATEGGVLDTLSQPKVGKKVEKTVSNLETLTGRLAGAASSAEGIVREIETGNGTAHDLIYGQSGKRLTKSLADASAELATLMRDVRTGDGTVHDLVYGEAAKELVENVTATTEDLRAIMADIRAGKGTIGGLIIDPSVYEDVKRLVGDLERNDILRALVRYSIRQGDTKATPPSVEKATESK